MNWFDIFTYLYIALRWSAKTLVGREVYKHFAPPEREDRCVLDVFPVLPNRAIDSWSFGPETCVPILDSFVDCE